MRIFTGSALLATPARPSTHTPASASFKRRMIFPPSFDGLARSSGKLLVAKTARLSGVQLILASLPRAANARHSVHSGAFSQSYHLPGQFTPGAYGSLRSYGRIAGLKFAEPRDSVACTVCFALGVRLAARPGPEIASNSPAATVTT